jgi:hypothetical protein
MSKELPLVDHRVYNIRPRSMGQFIELFDTLAMPILMETLGNPIAFYTTTVGTLNQFTHLWAYKSLVDYEERCHKRDTHPEFARYLSETDGLIISQETKLIHRVAQLEKYL